jgi:hypothetical protein
MLLAALWPPGVAAEPAIIGIVDRGRTGPGSLHAGAAAALEERQDGAPPFELRAVEAEEAWRDLPGKLGRLTFEGNVVALLGPLDGAGAHIAAQVATLRRVPILTLSGEDSVTRAFDPWVFRGVPSDVAQARSLLAWALDEPGGSRVLGVVPDGRDGRERSASLREACEEIGISELAVVQPSTQGLPEVDAVLLWLDAKEAADFLVRRHSALAGALLLGSVRLDHGEFVSRVGRWGEGLVLPRLRDAGRALDETLGYEMTRALLTAAAAAPNPADLRQALASGVRFESAAGSFSFDERGNRVGDVPMGVLYGGELIALP